MKPHLDEVGRPTRAHSVSGMRYDPADRNRPRRLAWSYLASLFLHALGAFLLVSIATSSSEQSSPESTQGGEIIAVTSQVVPKSVPAAAPHAAAPIPHAPVARRAIAMPRSAPPHPRVLHELSKNAPNAAPNPTPEPMASSAPNPQPTQPEIALSPLPLPLSAPTAAPATIAAANIRVPPTQPPTPLPTSAPTIRPLPRPVATAAPRRVVRNPIPQPSAPRATIAPIVAMSTPHPARTPGIPQVRVRTNPSPGAPSPGPAASPNLTRQRGANPSPGPRSIGSPGPHGAAPAKRAGPVRPIQALPSPPPSGAGHGAPKRSHPRPSNLNANLKSLIPTGPPPSPSSKFYQGNIAGAKPGPAVEPTPPPQVIAATKYIFELNSSNAGYEGRVKMYVTSVRHLAFGVNVCSGWLLRYPKPPPHGTLGGYRLDSNFDVAPKPIIEPNATYMCAGHLTPFTPPTPAP